MLFRSVERNLWREYRAWPAAVSVHHAYVGGLLEHSLSVTRSAAALARSYAASRSSQWMAIGENMNLEKVIFGFFVTLAAALNFGFWTGPIDSIHAHNGAELAAALVISLIATLLKFGDRTQLGAVHLATSMVADLQLVTRAILRVNIKVCRSDIFCRLALHHKKCQI